MEFQTPNNLKYMYNLPGSKRNVYLVFRMIYTCNQIFFLCSRILYYFATAELTRSYTVNQHSFIPQQALKIFLF